MTATATTPAAEARERYLAAYRTFAGERRGPDWGRELRERAIARFEATGFPTTRQEEWRFTSVAPLVEAAFQLGADATRVTPAPSGVSVESFGAAAAGRHAALLQTHLGRYAKIDANPFTALATAFLGDGTLVHVPAGQRVDEPIVVTHAPRAAETMTTPRLLVVVEAGDRLLLFRSASAMMQRNPRKRAAHVPDLPRPEPGNQ